MAEFGWAYIDCEDGGSSGASGPTGSVQFHHAGETITGSYDLIFHTASAPFELRLTGTLSVSGTINANQLNIDVTNKSVINLDVSGSTKFGDTEDDTHEYSGSLFISGGVNYNYSKLITSTYEVTGSDYILGVSQHGYMSITLPAATIFKGRFLIIKDEVDYSGGVRPSTHPIGITASAGGTLDGNGDYEISNGTFAAISLYSDGVGSWFII
jgi:hypothetical protein